MSDEGNPTSPDNPLAPGGYREQEMTLGLSDSAKAGDQGSITLTANLVPKSREEREQVSVSLLT